MLAAFRMGPMHWLLTFSVLLAQTGTSKTAVGWGIVLLCIGLGVLVVCRPSARNPAEKKKVKKKK
jgi:hypothetical protein